MEKRLLLVEILNTDVWHNHRSEYYPFVKQYCQERGIPTEWVVLGVPTVDPSSGENTYIFGLSETDQNLLHREIHRFNPTHVLVNERLSPYISPIDRKGWADLL